MTESRSCETAFAWCLRASSLILGKIRGGVLRLFVLGRCNRGLRVGPGFKFRHGRRMYFGRSVKIGRYCRFECFNDHSLQSGGADIYVGDYVHFGDNVHIGALGKIEIGNGVLFGSNILLIDHNHGWVRAEDRDINTMPKDRPLVYRGSIVIEENCWICDGVILLGGSIVRRGAVVPAGRIVKGEWKA